MLPIHHMVVQTIFHIAAVHLVTAKNTNQLNLIQWNGKLVKKNKVSAVSKCQEIQKQWENIPLKTGSFHS